MCRLINWSGRFNKFINEEYQNRLKVFELAVLNNHGQVFIGKQKDRLDKEDVDAGVNQINPDDVFQSNKENKYSDSAKVASAKDMINQKEDEQLDENYIAFDKRAFDEASTLDEVSSYPLTDFQKSSDMISFIKIDVGGSEISILQSAFPFFDEDRVDNVFVNFGPPKHWMNTVSMHANEGLNILSRMERYDFEIRLLATSSVYHEFRETVDKKNKHFLVLKTKLMWKKLINVMMTLNSGSQLWFARNPMEMDAEMNDNKEQGGSWLRI